MCVDLSGRLVILAGEGPQIKDKAEKLRPFGSVLRQVKELRPEDLDQDPAFVVVGDLDETAAREVCSMCAARGIPVNVVDRPELSSFAFPALITKGDLTVSVSTGGKIPGAAAFLRDSLATQLPDRTDEILDWLHSLRQTLYAGEKPAQAHRILRQATARCFAQGTPLTQEQLHAIVSSVK